MQTAALGGERLPLAAAAEESESAEESECSNLERKQLRQRLDELQDKKGQMERLLNELQMLRQYRSSGGQGKYHTQAMVSWTLFFDTCYIDQEHAGAHRCYE